jgi:hypothetical protein
MFSSSKYQIVRQKLSSEQRIDAVQKLNDLLDDPEDPVVEDDLRREGRKLIYQYSNQINLVWKESNYSPYFGAIYYQQIPNNKWQGFLQPVNEIEIKHLTQLEDFFVEQEKSIYQAELLLRSTFLISLIGFWLILTSPLSAVGDFSVLSIVFTSLLFLFTGCLSFAIALKLYLKRVDYQSIKDDLNSQERHFSDCFY